MAGASTSTRARPRSRPSGGRLLVAFQTILRLFGIRSHPQKVGPSCYSETAPTGCSAFHPENQPADFRFRSQASPQPGSRLNNSMEDTLRLSCGPKTYVRRKQPPFPPANIFLEGSLSVTSVSISKTSLRLTNAGSALQPESTRRDATV